LNETGGKQAETNGADQDGGEPSDDLAPDAELSEQRHGFIHSATIGADRATLRFMQPRA